MKTLQAKTPVRLRFNKFNKQITKLFECGAYSYLECIQSRATFQIRRRKKKCI